MTDVGESDSALLCDLCKLRPGTEVWCESGVIGHIHGMSKRWCKRCVLEAQLKHSKMVASNIPELQALLDGLGADDDNPILKATP